VSETLAAREPSSNDGEAERRRITGRASIVAAGTLASRLLGLVRDQVIAAVFSRAATDVFFVALLIPNVLRQLLAEGAVQNAVLPVLAATREKEGEQAAKRYFRAVRGLSILVLCAVSLAGIAAAPWLVDLFAGGFREHPGQYERTVTLTRWTFPYILLIGTAALGVAALNTYKRFTVAAFAPGLLNVAFIVCALALPGWLRTMGWDVVLALAIGTLLGGVLQAAAQWPSLRAIGYLERPSFELNHPGVRETLRRMGPVLFGIGVYLIDVVLARRFLSELDVGSQSYFAWALRLCDFPQGIFVMALQSATLPSLALIVARGEHEELSKTFAFGLRLALFVGIAATALVVALAEPLVVMIFQRGEFDAVASSETARALVAQGLGIWTVAAVRQLVAVYYAVGDTRSPVVVAATDLLVFIAVALLLRGPLGHVGISIAVSAASTAQMILLFIGLRRHLVSLRLGELTRSFLKTSTAAGLAALAGIAALYPLRFALHGGAIARLAPGLVGTAVFAVVFLISARVLKSEELETLLDVFRRRRAKKSAA
jgi:putative peptidoglycan lipid II flippase